MRTEIEAIASYLPGVAVTNAQLARDYPSWGVDRIAAKTGILERHLAAPEECASDLAFEAARRLFASGKCSAGEIDFVLFCTQSADYLLPTTACMLQDRLGIPSSAGALDVNLGCSGYVYGLGLAQGLIETGQAKRLLLLTADTYSKSIEPGDRSLATIFGDAGTATLLSPAMGDWVPLRPVYVYGTDGSGAQHLILRSGAMRERAAELAGKAVDSKAYLSMNGPEVFLFAMKTVPVCVRELLAKCGRRIDDIDLFILHQANWYMLENLRVKLEIPEDRFFVSMTDCGNTVSGTIPIALERAQAAGRLRAGYQVVLVGFGVGFSWGATLLTWPALGVKPLAHDQAASP